MRSQVLFCRVVDLGFDHTLIVKEEAEKFCKLIIEKLKNLPGGFSLIIDFSEIELIINSVTNEIVYLWKRLISGEFDEKFLILHGLTEETESSFQLSLSTGHSVMVIYDSALRLIGDLDSVNIETWNYVTSNNGITAHDMHCEFPELSMNACSTRLKRLFDRRLISRVKKAKYYTYFPVPHK